MSATRRCCLPFAAACATCLLIAGYARAQQIQQPTAPGQLGQQDVRRTPADAQQSDQNLIPSQPRTTHFRGPDAAGSAAGSATQGVDYYLANCWQIKNNAEIQISEFAEGRAQNPQVKQFAEQMVQDHRQLAQRLGQLTGASRTATAAQGTPAAAAGNNATLNQLLQIDRQITDKCVSMAQEKLGQKSGAEFDKCYVSAQIGGHMQMLAALEVISQQANGQLQQTAQDAKATVQKHLEQAEQLMKQLDSGTANQANRQARS